MVVWLSDGTQLMLTFLLGIPGMANEEGPQEPDAISPTISARPMYPF
jgi:hypothetical protein